MTMPKNTLRNSLAALAVVMLPLLTACGGSGDQAGSGAGHATSNADGAQQVTTPDGADAQTKKEYIQENAIAACMKKQGFTYTPKVGQTQTQAQEGSAATLAFVSAMDGEDYAQAKKFRQKYGFGTYASAAYPDDPNAPSFGARGKKTSQNNDQKGLTPAQQKAYETALDGAPPKNPANKSEADRMGGCEAKGSIAAYGKPLSAEAEKKAWAAKEQENKANGLELNGDPHLVQLAQQYASCLKGQGIPVSTTQPTGMASMVRLDLTSKLPEKHTWTKEEALPLLTADIDTAMKDLECGKDFRAAYFPKEKAHPYWGNGA